MIENKSYYNKLFDCYGNLFTPKQQEYFKSYFHDDLSLAEISENLDVSRAGVSKNLKSIKDQLDKIEATLNLVVLYDKIDFILENIDTLDKNKIRVILEEIGGEE